jgi:recombination protein RecT
MTTAVAERPKQQLTIRDRLKDPAIIAEMARAMPAHCKPERMARIALTALTRTPKLAECDQASFFSCLMSLSQWGLEPDGRRAHLIPFGKQCTLIIDYKGLVELAFRSGVVEAIHADVVHTGDIFRYSMGEVLEHVPHFLRTDEGKPSKEGEVLAVYCTVRLKGGCQKTEVLSKNEVDGIRARSRSGSAGPWKTDWNEMAKKTAFRRVSKWLPLSAEIQDAMERDEDTLTQIQQHRPAIVSQSLDGISSLMETAQDAEYIENDAHQGEHIDEPNQEAPAPLLSRVNAQTSRGDVEILRKHLLAEATTDEERDEINTACDKRRAEIKPKG